MGLEVAHGGDLVLVHQPAVTGNIGGKNGGEPTRYRGLFVHAVVWHIALRIAGQCFFSKTSLATDIAVHAGWACHAVRAPGSNVTRAPDVRDGSFASNSGSTRAEPLKFSPGQRMPSCDRVRLTRSSSRVMFSVSGDVHARESEVPSGDRDENSLANDRPGIRIL